MILGGIAALTLAGTAQAQTAELKAEPLRGNVYVIFGQGGNIGVSAGEDGVFIIDDQYAPLNDRIRAAIAKISDKDIRYVINTHYHGDHTGGNEAFGKTGSVIIAHDNVRQQLTKGAFLKAFNNKMEPYSAVALPVVTFSDEMSLHLNGDDARIIHAKNGHTDGDSFIFFKETNLVHMGDLFFNGIYPFIDVDHGGSIGGMIAASDQVLAMVNDETIIIPGHGPVTDKAGLQAFKAMLTGTRDIVAKLKADGKSLEEIQAMKPFESYSENWKGFNAAWVGQYAGFIFNSIK
ncbi:MAG: MBL fold metallo-hydrolase [Kordiimonadaceae bacterium]|nr:MBL fold metallo-hydrolase [Kordiimonadaceae bacterium]